jgi:hypothetical protein
MGGSASSEGRRLSEDLSHEVLEACVEVPIVYEGELVTKRRSRLEQFKAVAEDTGLTSTRCWLE